MTLNEYIEQLQKLAKQYPDAVLIYASDDEGNSFDIVSNTPTKMYFDEEENAAYNNEKDGWGNEMQIAICIN